MAQTALVPMTTDHLDQVIAIDAAAFSIPWTQGMILDEIGRQESINLIAGQSLSGYETDIFAFFCARLLANELHILKVAVLKPYRRRGIATDLIRKAFEIVREKAYIALLEVRSTNFSALRFYENNGFVKVGKRINYYPDEREDALIMQKNLKEAT